MEITQQTLPHSRIKCSVKISAEERTKAEAQALTALAKRVNIKGFRPGMAPPDKVKASIDPDDLLKETARIFLPEAIRKSMEETKAAPILAPQVSVESQEPLTLSIVFVLKPEVSLKKPDRISVEKKETAKIEQKDIDEFLQRALAPHRVETVIDRPAARGDVVYVSSEATGKDGTAIAEISHPSIRLTVGSADDFVPGISDHLQGMKTNDVKEIDAAFPDSHAVPTLRGKTAKVKVSVKSVAESKLPELTAEFLESKLRVKKTPAEFRTEVEKMLGDQRMSEERRRREENFFDKVREATTVDLAPELVDAEVQEMLQDLQGRLQKDGLSMEDWIKAMGKEPKEIVDMMKETATKQLSLRLGLEELMNHKKITADEEQMKKILTEAKTSAATGGDMDPKDFEPEGSAYRQIEWDLRMRKLMEEYVG